MRSQARRAPGREDPGQSPAAAGRDQAPDVHDLIGNAALASIVEGSKDPGFFADLIAGSPMPESELLKLLGSSPELEAAPVEGMGDAGQAPEGWGTQIGEYRGVPAYSNGPAGSDYSPRGDYGLMYQCVEYVNRFAVEALGLSNMTRTGHAKDYTNNRAGLTWVPNQADAFLPQPDDLLVFGGGSFGHVAIATQTSASAVHFIHQNSSTGAFSSATIAGSPGRTEVSAWGSYTLLGWQSPTGAVAVEGNEATREDPGGTYTVASGDSLSLIAGRVLGSTDRWPELAALNGLIDPYTLTVGQRLALPGAGPEQAAGPEQEQEAPEVVQEQAVAPVEEAAAAIDAPTDARYVVKSGDSLWAIAAAQLGDGERWTEIAQANGIDAPHLLKVDQELVLPGLQTPLATDTQSVAPEPPRSVTAQPGDSLWAIAQRELGDGNRWPEIQRLNGLNGTEIHPGDELQLPARGGQAA